MKRRVAPVVAAVVGLFIVGCTSDPAPLPTSTTAAASKSVDALKGSSSASETSTASGTVAVAALRRPLHLPSVGKGRPCPVTLSQHQPDPSLGLVQGNGPAGPVGLSAAGVLRYVGAADASALTDKSWVGQKVLWAVDSTVDGAVMVRGGQLDGDHLVRFNDPAVAELLLPPKPPITPGGWRDYPSETRLQASGCYAYQIDAPATSTIIVFRAEGPVLVVPAPTSTEAGPSS